MNYAKDEEISRLHFDLTLTIKLKCSYIIFNSETKRIGFQ